MLNDVISLSVCSLLKKKRYSTWIEVEKSFN